MDLIDNSPIAWQMSLAERRWLLSTIEAMKPRRVIEVGAGASTLAFAAHARRVVSIDKAPSVELRDLLPRNVRLLRGRSRWLLPPALRLPAVDVVLIDGDHSHLGARDDLDTVLRARPRGERMVIMHDTSNPGCRGGLEAAAWATCRWLIDLDLDVLTSDTGWGGIGVARLAG